MTRGHRTLLSIWWTRCVALLAVLMLLQPLHDASLACLAFELCESEPSSKVSAQAPEERGDDDCCPKPRGSPSGAEHQEDCPCPFACGLGCGGQARAVVTATLLPEWMGREAVAVFVAHSQRAPQNPEPLGIAHVPKLVVA